MAYFPLICYNDPMKFFRVNNNTIKCMIPVSDLAERGITPEDIVGQKREALEFLHEVIMTGAREVGIPENEPFTTLQLAIINQDMLVLLASKGDCRIEVENFWKELNSKLGGSLFSGAAKQFAAAIKKTPNCFLFRVDSLYDAIQLSSLLPPESMSGMHSMLYRDLAEDKYLLILRSEEAAPGFPGMLCLASEFGKLTVADEARLAFIMEQGECLIPEHAAQKLRELSLKGQGREGSEDNIGPELLA